MTEDIISHALGSEASCNNQLEIGTVFLEALFLLLWRLLSAHLGAGAGAVGEMLCQSQTLIEPRAELSAQPRLSSSPHSLYASITSLWRRNGRAVNTSHAPSFSIQWPWWRYVSRLSLLYFTPIKDRDMVAKKSCRGERVHKHV